MSPHCIELFWVLIWLYSSWFCGPLVDALCIREWHDRSYLNIIELYVCIHACMCGYLCVYMYNCTYMCMTVCVYTLCIGYLVNKRLLCMVNMMSQLLSCKAKYWVGQRQVGRQRDRQRNRQRQREWVNERERERESHAFCRAVFYVLCYQVFYEYTSCNHTSVCSDMMQLQLKCGQKESFVTDYIPYF